MHPHRYTLSCRARVAESVISLDPWTVNLGDCNIGEYHSFSVAITNGSELPAVVQPQVVSKVVSLPDDSKITIPPKEAVSLKIEYVARKINSKYRKTVTLVNCMNPRDTKQLEIQVRACLKSTTWKQASI